MKTQSEKDAHAAYMRLWHQENKVEINSRARDRYHASLEESREKGRNKARRYDERHPGKRVVLTRAWRARYPWRVFGHKLKSLHTHPDSSIFPTFSHLRDHYYPDNLTPDKVLMLKEEYIYG